MKASEVKAAFPSEADLCDCFIESIRAVGGWTVYPETAGFDILAVYDETGHQLGIEAKLQLNAKVADQIIPADSYWEAGSPGPDFRAVIVPCITDASVGIARMLGILGVLVWAPDMDHHYKSGNFERVYTFVRAFGRNNYLTSRGELIGNDRRAYDAEAGRLMGWDSAWHDWNPPRRCDLPEIVPTVRAGVPAPIRLTPWKIGALRVMADLEIHGFVTAKSVREHSVDSRRFCASDGWLQSLGGGRWGMGTMPRFDKQHPDEYAQIIAIARSKVAA